MVTDNIYNNACQTNDQLLGQLSVLYVLHVQMYMYYWLYLGTANRHQIDKLINTVSLYST